MTRRVRSDTIIHRFLAGWSIGEIAFRLNVDYAQIEGAIRNALNRKRRSK